MKKSVAKITAFIIVFVLLFNVFYRVFVFKTTDGPYQMSRFYDERDNTVDVIFMGSSHMFTNASPAVLWEEYGMASYDLCGSIQPYWNTYHYLKEAYKTQKPKVVVWDVYTAIMYKEMDYGIYENAIKNTFGMKLSKNKIDAIKASVKEDDRLLYYFEYPTYHKRYTDINKDDFYFLSKEQDTQLFCWKGQRPFFTKSVEKERPSDDILNDTSVGSVTEKHEQYLRMIIDLCKANGTTLILTVNPYTVFEGDMPILNRVKEIADETGTEFINFNLLYDEIGIDFNGDFCDECHMHLNGSERFSRYLGKVIKDRVDIPDHRGEKEYASYDHTLAEYRAAVQKYLEEEKETK